MVACVKELFLMRRKITIPLAIPLLVLPLRGGYVGSDHLMTSKPTDPSAVEETVSLLESERHYTSHRAADAKSIAQFA